MSLHMRKFQSGMMLLEALVGILIFSIGILAMLGMQAISMQATIDAKYRSEASFLASEIIGAMWVDRGNIADYDTASGAGTARLAAWVSRVQATLPNAASANAPTVAVSGRLVTVTVRWQRSGEATASNHEAVAHINDPT